MGRNRRRKLERQQQLAQRSTDPERSARLQAQRAREDKLRAGLETVLRLGGELSAHVHYDKLGKDVAAEAQPLSERLQTLIKQSPDRLGDCLLKNGAVEEECRRLEQQLAGKDDTDRLAAQDKILDLLPKEQADAIRFVMALQEASPPVPDDEVQAVFEAADVTRVQMTALLEDLRTLRARALAVADEKVKRGWMTQADIAPFQDQLAEHDQLLQRWVEGYSSMLDAMRIRGTELLARRADLKRQIGAR